jgi:hypothetical protein
MAQKKAPAKKARRAPKEAAREESAVPDSSHELQARLASLLKVWEQAAGDPSLGNVQQLAKVSADMEAGVRQVREQAEALERAARVSASSLKSIRESAPAAVLEPTKELELGVLEQLQAGNQSFDFAGFASPAPVTPAQTLTADMPLESFFHQVSDSVVKAQQRLDLVSIAYSQGLKDSPIPPSFFSIPKVTAQIKLGLTVENGSNLLVKLLGRPEDTTNFSESTVSFDVVASAPPPGGPGIYTAPIPGFLVVGQERDTVVSAITGIRDAIRNKTGIDLASDPSQWLPSTIVVRAGSEILPAANRADYLVLWRDDDPSKPVLAVRFRIDKPQEGQIMRVADIDLCLSLFDLVATMRDWESSVTVPLARV